MPDRSSSPEPIDLAELAARAVAAARSGEAVEAYAEESRRTQIRVRGQDVESLTFAESRGVGVRVISDGRLGYAYAAAPDADGVAELVRSAREAAGFAHPDQGNVLPAVGEFLPMPEVFDPSQAGMPTERKVDLSLAVERAAVSAHQEVRKVESVSHGDASSRVVIASTEGGPVEYSRTDCWVAVSALAERNGETQSGFAYRVARRLDDLPWEATAREAADRAARLLGGTKPRSERLPVVLDPVAATSFLGVLAGALSAESVLKGRSLLAGRVGEEIGSSLVTLVDDGRLPEGPAAAPFDDEGVPTERTVLLDRGTLRGLLHDTYTAARMDERSTGNGARGSYRTVPGVSPSNLFIPAGEGSLQALLQEAGRGVYVQDVTGIHSGANPISGEFSVGATGLRIEGGDLAGPLREMTVASTLLELLASVAALGSDLRFFGGGLGSPTVLVGEMTVGGT
jgi:PmbA protein